MSWLGWHEPHIFCLSGLLIFPISTAFSLQQHGDEWWLHRESDPENLEERRKLCTGCNAAVWKLKTLLLWLMMSSIKDPTWIFEWPHLWFGSCIFLDGQQALPFNQTHIICFTNRVVPIWLLRTCFWILWVTCRGDWWYDEVSVGLIVWVLDILLKRSVCTTRVAFSLAFFSREKQTRIGIARSKIEFLVKPGSTKIYGKYRKRIWILGIGWNYPLTRHDKNFE